MKEWTKFQTILKCKVKTKTSYVMSTDICFKYLLNINQLENCVNVALTRKIIIKIVDKIKMINFSSFVPEKVAISIVWFAMKIAKQKMVLKEFCKLLDVSCATVLKIENLLKQQLFTI